MTPYLQWLVLQLMGPYTKQNTTIFTLTQNIERALKKLEFQGKNEVLYWIIVTTATMSINFDRVRSSNYFYYLNHLT